MSNRFVQSGAPAAAPAATSPIDRLKQMANYVHGQLLRRRLDLNAEYNALAGLPAAVDETAELERSVIALRADLVARGFRLDGSDARPVPSPAPARPLNPPAPAPAPAQSAGSGQEGQKTVTMTDSELMQTILNAAAQAGYDVAPTASTALPAPVVPPPAVAPAPATMSDERRRQLLAMTPLGRAALAAQGQIAPLVAAPAAPDRLDEIAQQIAQMRAENDRRSGKRHRDLLRMTPLGQKALALKEGRKR